MKRFLSYTIRIMILFLLLGLFACGTDDNAVSEGEQGPAASTEPTATPEPPQEEVVAPVAATEPATLPPVPTPSPTPTPKPTPVPTPSPTPVPTPFTILWIADTQNYAFSSDKGLISIVDFVLRTKDERNIVAVLHSGDIVENNGLDSEWEKIGGDLAPLRGVVPFYCVCGNHDLGYGTGQNAIRKPGYGQYFKYDLCDVREESQRYHDGECWYQFMEEQKILLVGIGWHLDDDRTKRNEWLDRVLDAYSDYPVLILTHNYLYNDGKQSEEGVRLEKEIISRHSNVRLLLCGHHKGIRRLDKTYEDGRVFTAIMYNLQLDRKKGAGYCTLLTFDPLTRSISFTSYSPYFDDYNYLDDPRKETFVLENAF